MKLVQSASEDSKSWLKCWQFWRIQLGVKVYRHTHPVHADRWVIQPTVVYDRKRK